MEDKGGFRFEDQTSSQQANLEFKRQRAAYLAQRNARKKEASQILRQERGNSTSSDEDVKPVLKQPPKFTLEQKDSSCSSSESGQVSNKKDFLEERQKYKAERIARRHQVARNKEAEFGPSSSSSDDRVPVFKPKIQVKQTSPMKREHKTLKNSASKQDFSPNPILTINFATEKSKSHNLHSSVKLKSIPEKKVQRQRFQIQVPSRKGVNIWLQQFLQFKDNTVEIGQKSIPLYDITKSKLFFIRTQTGNSKLKITYQKEDIFLAVDHKRLNQFCLDHYYYIFAKLVSLKLQVMGRKPTTQLKPKISLSEQQLKGAQITGKVRKSSFFGGWQESIGVVNQSGLCIYKQGKQKPLLMIGYNSIRELWTRFEFDNDNLIIKFLHGNSKVELSIPFQNYLSRDNWLYHIYNLANK